MTLGQILSHLDSAAEYQCIVARRPWRESSDAMLVRLDDDGGVPSYVKAAGYDYFLEVHIIKDEVLGEWSAGMSSAQRSAVVLHYAEYDAWPEWFHELIQGSSRV